MPKFQFSYDTNNPKEGYEKASVTFDIGANGSVTNPHVSYGGKDYEGVAATRLLAGFGMGEGSYGKVVELNKKNFANESSFNNLVNVHNTSVEVAQAQAKTKSNEPEKAQGISAELQKEAVAAILNSKGEGKYNAMDPKFMQEKLASQENQRFS